MRKNQDSGSTLAKFEFHDTLTITQYSAIYNYMTDLTQAVCRIMTSVYHAHFQSYGSSRERAHEIHITHIIHEHVLRTTAEVRILC